MNCIINPIKVDGKNIGNGFPVFIIAEMSANHHQDFKKAADILKAAKEAGADAVKIQTYTPETMTIKCNRERFMIKGGTLWDGISLYELYQRAFTPWQWYPKLKEIAEKLDITLFSTPFDETAVDFLEKYEIPVYKIASYEAIDLPLLKKIARTKKPVIMSTGISTLSEISEAVETLKFNGCSELSLLKCTSSYPAPLEEMNLRSIQYLIETFNLPVGISDHTLSTTTSIASVALGASIVEKHLTLSRKDEGPDSKFSIEPKEFNSMVDAIRETEKLLGQKYFGETSSQVNGRKFARSIFAVKDIKKNEVLTKENIRTIRPGDGLHPRYYEQIIGRNAIVPIQKGTPLNWYMVN